MYNVSEIMYMKQLQQTPIIVYVQLLHTVTYIDLKVHLAV